MRKSGIGHGAASIILVFAVLCLTIFTLIALNSADSDKKLSDKALTVAVGYYAADTQAEMILAEILEAETVPETVQGVEITVYEVSGGETISYACPVSDSMELYVEFKLYSDSYEITEWRMQDTQVWTMDQSMPVWPGY